ncbi:MAG: hypothetical protein H6741_30530 [Alphaproteobacteria bacterium]|nr:hypothetical protein [Alphaproteobacteria bacterium]
MRRLDALPAALPEVEAVPGQVSWRLRLRAVTPIYKGGSNPKGIDAGRPFRGASIRGLVRYWWRATVDERDPERLWRREMALFGGVFDDKPVASKVRVSVHGATSDARAIRKEEGFGYALWPSEMSKDEDPRPFHREGARADLRISGPRAAEEELARALSAWLLLGGVGSRGRRGLGAVWDDDQALQQTPESVEALAARVAELAPPLAERPWPSLGGGWLAVGAPNYRDAMSAWRAALDAMQALRSANSDDQLGRLARDFPVIAEGQGRVPGERAALGMPLPFRWKEEGRDRWLNATMNPAGHNRYPSPVHLRPVPVGGKWAPLMCALRDDLDLHLEVSGRGRPTLRGTVNPDGVRIFMQGLSQRLGWALFPLEVSR